MTASVRYSFILMLLFAGESFGQLRLTKIYVNGAEKIIPQKHLQLKASENDLILEFEDPANSPQYLYQLEGFDKNWISSTYPTTRYQELPAGTYIFRIKPKSGNAETATLKISKEMAFWNEWWFVPSIVIYALVLIGVGIYLFFLYDFRQKLKIQHVRNQIAADLHDEVGSNLNSIAIFVEVLRRKAPQDMLPILEKIINNSRESVALMQDTVWTINPKNDGIFKLFERMNSFASQVLSSKDIAFSFEVQADIMRSKFSMEQRKNVYLIFKEAINNIVKHANATKVNVHIGSGKDCLEIMIEDNGEGFDATENHEGNGLFNFRERSEEAEISLMIESELSVGTKISMRIPG